MISKVAKSVLLLQKGSNIMQIIPCTLKLTHSFSDKNPFDKFKRKNQTKINKPNDQKVQKKKEDSQSQPQTQQNNKVNMKNQKTSKQQSPNSTTSQSGSSPFSKFKRSNNSQPKHKIDKVQAQSPKQKKQNHIENQKPKIVKPSSQSSKSQIPGFSKFMRNTSMNPKTQKTNEKQKPQMQKKVSMNAKQQKQSSTQTNKTKVQGKKTAQKPINTGFSKFQRKGSPNKNNQSQPKKTEQKKQTQQNEQKYKQASDKEQHILNQKKQQQGISKQEINKKTQQKIQSDKEQWQKFYQQQIKKNKQNLNQSPLEKKFKRLQQMSFMNNNQSKQDGKNPQGSPQGKNPNDMMKKLMILGGIFWLASYIYDTQFSSSYPIISTDVFVNKLKSGQVTETWFEKNIMSIGDQTRSTTSKYSFIRLANGQIYKCQSNNDFQNEWVKLVDSHNADMLALGGNLVIKKPPIIQTSSHIFSSVRHVLSFALLFMFLSSLRKGAGGQAKQGKGGMSGLFDNAKSHRFRQTVNVKFDDVVGMNKAKQQIVQFIDFLKKPQKYSALGAKIPRGALLTGPPGTGKTMIAKACAGESGVPFFTISGSQFVEMYVGVGAQRVRSLFKQAKQSSPSIIFIDQIDAVGKKRSSGVGGGGNDERDNTLNQLLVEMDGFDKTANVIVFAATNQKEVLDPALTRPGRFDRLIEVDLPDIEGRKEIFHVHLTPLTLDMKFQKQDYARRLATLTPGFSGADIKNLCNEAAIIAARNGKDKVSMIDFQMASERIIGGVQKKSALITPQTKRTVAYHECGHGVVSWFMEHASPLLKLTIIPRSKGALGYAQYLPNQNQVYTRKQLQDQICVILGGRIAEEIFFKKISTGASDDLQKAHQVAKAIVAEYGMGKNLGWLSYGQTQYARHYSDLTAERIDEEMTQIVKQCAIKTRKIINDKKQIIKQLAQILLAEETIDQRTIQKVLGQRPFKSTKQYEEYIKQRKKLDDEQDEQKKKLQDIKQVTFRTFNLKSSKIQILES